MWSITTSTSGTPDSSSPPAEPSGSHGLFIVFEGIEGSGKSTQLRLLAEALHGEGIDPVVTREPGGTTAGEAIREVVLDAAFDLSPAAELLLMLAARSTFVQDVVRPSLEMGRIVLSDRYELSTFAYQSGGRGLPLEKVRQLNDLATGGLRPDLCLLLDVEVETGMRRKRHVASDRIESADHDFHRRVAKAYRELADSDPGIASIDAGGEIGKVFAHVWRELADRFPETFLPGKG